MSVNREEVLVKLLKQTDFDLLVAIITDHNIPLDVARSIAIVYFEEPDDENVY